MTPFPTPPAPVALCQWTGCGRPVLEGEEAVIGKMRFAAYHFYHFGKPRRTPDGKGLMYRMPGGGWIRVGKGRNVKIRPWETRDQVRARELERQKRGKGKKPEKAPPGEEAPHLTRRQALLARFATGRATASR